MSKPHYQGPPAEPGRCHVLMHDDGLWWLHVEGRVTLLPSSQQRDLNAQA